MIKRKEGPPPIQRRMLVTGIIGVMCLLIGLAFFLLFRDRIMLFLSLVLCAFCIGRAWEYYRIIAGKRYETVEGVCVAITPKPLTRYRKIKITDDDGSEYALLIDKHSKIKIGARYRFYFKETRRLSFGSEYLDSAISYDCFLGYEEVDCA